MKSAVEKLIISGLTSAGSADALRMVNKCWDDPDLRDEAEQTGSHLMESLKASQPAEVKELATKLATSKNAGVADRARKILADPTK